MKFFMIFFLSLTKLNTRPKECKSRIITIDKLKEKKKDKEKEMKQKEKKEKRPKEIKCEKKKSCSKRGVAYNSFIVGFFTLPLLPLSFFLSSSQRNTTHEA